VTGGWLIFSDSPVHTDAFYAAKAREFIDRCGVDELMIEDTSGILTPERIRTLVPALRAEIGGMRLGLHTHNLIGLAQRAYIEAADLGIDQFYTCIAPIADGNAPPSIHTTLRNLRHWGAESTIDLDVLDEVSAYFEALAARENKPRGVAQDFNLVNFDHQIPGGVLSNLASQLADAGYADKLDQVLEECGRIRRELGWPIMVTPFSQFVGVQATLNVISGERYASVPDEIKQYALGYFGALPAAVEPDVLDRIVENGSRDIAETPPEQGDAIPALRKRYPNADDEELLLRRSFPQNLVDESLAAKPDNTDYGILEKPLHRILREMAERPKLTHVVVHKGGMRIEMRR
jgi:oxaloacetate decarboxylase alpha subunit